MVDFNNIMSLLSGYAAQSQGASRRIVEDKSPLARFKQASAPRDSFSSEADTIGRALAAPQNGNTIVPIRGDAGLSVFSQALRQSTRPGFTASA